MFGLDLPTLRKVWTVFLFLLVVALLYLVGRTIVVFTLAVFLAHLVGPMVDRIDRVVPDRYLSHNATLALVYLILLMVSTTALIPLFSLVGEQASGLAARLPALLDNDPLTEFSLPPFLEPARGQLTEFLRSSFAHGDQTLLPLLQNLGRNAASVLGSALALVLIPILSFFFLKDSRELHASLIDLVPAAHRQLAEDILNDLHVLLVQYIRSLMILAVIVAIVYFAFLEIAGVPYAMLLATIAALLEVVPVVGPLVASAIIVLVALLTGFPHIWWLILFLIVFRLLQDYAVNPHLMSTGVSVHPLLVLFGVLAGEQIAGIAGMFFSVPVIAALRIVFVRLRRKNLDSNVLMETSAE